MAGNPDSAATPGDRSAAEAQASEQSHVNRLEPATAPAQLATTDEIRELLAETRELRTLADAAVRFQDIVNKTLVAFADRIEAIRTVSVDAARAEASRLMGASRPANFDDRADLASHLVLRETVDLLAKHFPNDTGTMVSLRDALRPPLAEPAPQPRAIPYTEPEPPVTNPDRMEPFGRARA